MPFDLSIISKIVPSVKNKNEVKCTVRVDTSMIIFLYCDEKEKIVLCE